MEVLNSHLFKVLPNDPHGFYAMQPSIDVTQNDRTLSVESFQVAKPR